jgi:outer membrane protein OmpA-like peptidoglycan-associated protein
MADDSGSPDYYPLRWKIADAAEDLFVLHRGKLVAFILVLLAGVVTGFFLFSGDDESSVTTGSSASTTVVDGDSGTPTTAGPSTPDDSTAPSTDDPSTDDGSTATSNPASSTTETPTTTEAPTTTTTEAPVSPRAPTDVAQLQNTEPGAVIVMAPDAIALIGGLPSDVIADETLDIARATFTGSAVVDDQVVDSSFPTPDQLLFRLSAPDLFGYNRDTINSTYLPLLDRLAAWLIAQPERVVEVGGHTDDSGPAPGNQRLSERRAQSAANYLTSQGVQSARVTVVGYGEDRPIESNATEAGQLANRRLEFVIRN